MSNNSFDKKQALEVFKFLNLGGILAVVVVAAVAAFMYGTGCGPIKPSANWGETTLTGRPVLQDHPEEQVVTPAAHTEEAAH